MKVKFKGIPVNLAGDFICKDAVAPNFRMAKGDLGDFTLAQAKGKKLILNIFPSLDTDICAMSVRKFNEIAGSLKNTVVLCISKDLPFAQKRFCTTENIKNVLALSDCRLNSTFGLDYGVEISSGMFEGLLTRAQIIISPEGIVKFAQLTPEIEKEPDYEAVLNALYNKPQAF
mgnify:FL=1